MESVEQYKKKQKQNQDMSSQTIFEDILTILNTQIFLYKQIEKQKEFDWPLAEEENALKNR